MTGKALALVLLVMVLRSPVDGSLLALAIGLWWFIDHEMKRQEAAA